MEYQKRSFVRQISPERYLLYCFVGLALYKLACGYSVNP
jgi:hypothetical protein